MVEETALKQRDIECESVVTNDVDLITGRDQLLGPFSSRSVAYSEEVYDPLDPGAVFSSPARENCTGN